MGVGQGGAHLARIAGHDVERADAVAVEPEVLVAAIGDQRLGHAGEHFAHAIGVLIHPVAKPLVGQIEHRQQRLFGKQRGNLVPLRGRVIDPCRVVAAAVEHDRIAALRRRDSRTQSVHVNRAIGSGMREGLQIKRQVGEDLRVVGPARRTHPHPRNARLLCQPQRQPHSAGAAGGLHPLDPAPKTGAKTGIVPAEDVRHQRMDEAHIAFGAEIAFGILRFQQPRFGRLDRVEHRGIALPGAIDPHPEINLVGARIRIVELDQREQRIGRLLGQGI